GGRSGDADREHRRGGRGPRRMADIRGPRTADARGVRDLGGRGERRLDEGPSGLQLRREGAPAPGRDGNAVECMAQAVAVRTADGDTVEILYALRRKPGTRGYEDRVLESIDGLAEIHTVEPPE